MKKKGGSTGSVGEEAPTMPPSEPAAPEPPSEPASEQPQAPVSMDSDHENKDQGMSSGTPSQ